MRIKFVSLFRSYHTVLLIIEFVIFAGIKECEHSLNEAMAHPRELFKASILSNAASMMLIHCHPSGNIFPSKADTMMTDRMNKLCELIGIPLLDHIIVGGDNRAFFSFKEKGMIDNPRITLSTDYRDLDIKSPLVAEQGKAR